MTDQFRDTTAEYPDLVPVIHQHDRNKSTHGQSERNQGNLRGRTGPNGPGVRYNPWEHGEKHTETKDQRGSVKPQDSSKIFVFQRITAYLFNTEQRDQAKQSPNPEVRTKPFSTGPVKVECAPDQVTTTAIIANQKVTAVQRAAI